MGEREGRKKRERVDKKEGRKSVIEELWFPSHATSFVPGGPRGLGKPLEGTVSPDLI